MSYQATHKCSKEKLYLFAKVLSKKTHEIFSLMKQLIAFFSPTAALKIRGNFIVIRNVRKSEGHVDEDRAAKGDQRPRGPRGSFRAGVSVEALL